MIESIHGIQETVNFKGYSGIKLYHNIQYENYPSHWHAPLEIIMATKNDYTAICSDQRFHLQEGDIIIINPGVLHSLEAPEEGERIIFQADFSILHSIKELESTLSIISPALLITADDIPSAYHRIQSLMLSIEEEYFEDAILSEATIYAKLIEILVLIGREYSPTSKSFDNNTKQKEYMDKFLYVCDYINEHCTEELTLDQMADLAGFSKYHFSRLFKQFANVSFYKYLNQKRIAYAEKLLIDPSASVTEVALRSGFSSLSAFIRMFKIVKGCTPSEFRSLYVY